MNWLKVLISTALLALTIAPADVAAQGKLNRRSRPRVRVLATLINRYKMVNKYVLVAKGLSEDELIKIARTLHRAEPAVTFWFLDDDSKAAGLLKFLKAYQAGETDLNDPMAGWIAEHTVANLQQYFGGGRGKYWALAKGIGMDKIAEIE